MARVWLLSIRESREGTTLIRNIGAVVVGLVIGMAVNMAIILLNFEVLYPMPRGTDMNNPTEFNAFLASLPASAFITVMLAHLSQSFVGAWFAAYFGTSHKMTLALFVGGMSLIGGLASMFIIDGPDWLVIELPLYLIVAWAAARVAPHARVRTSAD